MKRILSILLVLLFLTSGAHADFFSWNLQFGSQIRDFRDSPVFDSADIVAVYYGTLEDDDNPGWGSNSTAQATSWYQETLNTATRGATRAFPTEYLIVAESATVTIYDATDPDLPMWMVFNQASSYMAGSPDYTVGVEMLNGELVICSESSFTSTCVIAINFVTDSCFKYSSYIASSGNWAGNISQRNTVLSVDGTGELIVNPYVNDIALTLLDDADTDPATGMRYVTIACATDGGVSVIDGPAGAGTVVDLTCSQTNYEFTHFVDFRDDGALVMCKEMLGE